ncbi:pseudouridine synthase [Oscillospiraceae bacterium LTW-04]|nr:pseudouridine synthase [Oscillospiraceae bacterium MB24-C1]
MAIIRLDKLLSTAKGVSRTDAKRLLSGGAVTVDGQTVKSGSEKVDPVHQSVLLKGTPIIFNERIYILMNKPLGVVSSTNDPTSRTVLDLLEPTLRRKGLFPAGRLDKYTEGMLIITDDGDFAHRILAPKNHLPKVYAFELDAPIVNAALVEKFSQGVYLGGGKSSSPAILEPLSETSGRVTIYEGIYHQVRRMFDQNGGKVTRLKRICIGGLALDPTLAPGESRLLFPKELEKLIYF